VLSYPAWERLSHRQDGGHKQFSSIISEILFSNPLAISDVNEELIIEDIEYLPGLALKEKTHMKNTLRGKVTGIDNNSLPLQW
jgi:hypothetical protein